MVYELYMQKHCNNAYQSKKVHEFYEQLIIHLNSQWNVNNLTLLQEWHNFNLD